MTTSRTTASTMPFLLTLFERTEQAAALDAPAAALQKVIRLAIPPGPIEDLLRGRPIGHPLHPALVTVPLGAWSCAALFDLVGDADAARRATAVGCLSALPSSAAGGAEFLATTGADRRVGFVHALINYAAQGSFALSWLARRRGARAEGVALSLAGAGLLTAGGWLGAHLAYARGVGQVET